MASWWSPYWTPAPPSATPTYLLPPTSPATLRRGRGQSQGQGQQQQQQQQLTGGAVWVTTEALEAAFTGTRLRLTRARLGRRAPTTKRDGGGGLFSALSGDVVVELFLEPYSNEPEFEVVMPDAAKAKALAEALVRLQRTETIQPTVVLDSAGGGASATGVAPTQPAADEPRVGVAGVMKRVADRQANESALARDAFVDLEQLMMRASEVTAVLERYSAASLARRGAGGATSDADERAFNELLAGIGIVQNPVTKASAGAAFHDALARELASFLDARAKASKTNASTVVTLPDVYALYNRARGGYDLVSPGDVLAASKRMAALGLGYEFVEYPSGVKALRSTAAGDAVRRAAAAWLGSSSTTPPTTPPRSAAELKPLSALQLSQSASVPLSVAKDWLVEEENQGRLVRDRDAAGNVQWFVNCFFA